MLRTIDEKHSQDILRGIVIPPCPQIVADIQLESCMPDVDINAIAALISRDAGIAGTVIKAINSPFFGLAGKITSVTHAVSLLGLKSVINIVTALALKNTLSDDSVASMNRFWDTAMDVANAATFISKFIRLGSPDEAYSIGIFHDCGIPLMMLKFPNYLSVLEKGYASSDKTVSSVENEHYKTDHTILGYYTAKAWKISPHICEVISVHHCVNTVYENNQKERTPQKNLLTVLKIAEHVCAAYRTLGGCSVDHEWEQIKDYVLDYARLSEDDILNITDECKEAGVF